MPDVDVYFVTTTVVGWEFVFTALPYFEVLIESLVYCVANKGLHLHGFVIMPNHAHYIFSTNREKYLSNILRDFNTHTSRHITALLTIDERKKILGTFGKAARIEGRGNKFKVWQDGFHPIAIETGEFFEQKLLYLHDNPVRKGYVSQPEHWLYSSARNYILGDHSTIKVECLI